MSLLAGFSRDLRRAANNGTEIRLKNGGLVRVRATTFAGLERIERAFPSWFGRVLKHFEEGGGVSPAALDSSLAGLLEQFRGALPDWQAPIVFILTDSNPDRPEIDADWVRDNLTLPDIKHVFAAWIDENELRGFWEDVKKKAAGYLASLIARAGASSETSSSPSS